MADKESEVSVGDTRNEKCSAESEGARVAVQSDIPVRVFYNADALPGVQNKIRLLQRGKNDTCKSYLGPANTLWRVYDGKCSDNINESK